MTPINRRQVLKTITWGTAFSTLLGRASSALLMGEVIRSGDRGVMRLSLGDFPALNEPFGSLRISTSPMNPAGERPLGFFPPVIINRGAGGQWHVLSAECTHEGCTVRQLDLQSQRMICPCHGSQYSIDGRALVGPATFPLREYEYTVDSGILSIALPDDVFYELVWQPVTLPPGPRMKLTFITFTNYRYEVYFRPTLEGPSTRTLFSRTPEGEFKDEVLEGIDDYDTIYLPRPSGSGFYQVALQTQMV